MNGYSWNFTYKLDDLFSHRVNEHGNSSYYEEITWLIV